MIAWMQGALAALVVVAGLAFAPAPASAHAGHRHHAPAVTAQHAGAQAFHGGIVQELRAAVPAHEHRHDGNGCGDRGCCSNGPCTACHGFIVTPVPMTVPPTLSSSLSARDPPHGASAASERLQRPPKSFA